MERTIVNEKKYKKLYSLIYINTLNTKLFFVFSYIHAHFQNVNASILAISIYPRKGKSASFFLLPTFYVGATHPRRVCWVHLSELLPVDFEELHFHAALPTYRSA